MQAITTVPLRGAVNELSHLKGYLAAKIRPKASS